MSVLDQGRPICVHGYIREYRKDEGDTSPYRAIVANDFSTRKDLELIWRESSKEWYSQRATRQKVDPTPDY